MSRQSMGDLLKHMQKIQERISDAQESLVHLRAEGSAGGGMVTVVANGRQEIVEVHIDKEVVNPDDVEMMEDLILVAVNQALSHAQELATAEVNKAAGGVLGNLPGGLKIPGL